MILRRDALGRLTFVNRSFLHTFGVAAEQVLGRPFNFDTCDVEGPAPLSTTDEVRQKHFIRQVHTATGPRWIEWEEQLVPAADGANLEVQSVGRDITDKRLVGGRACRGTRSGGSR